jgi:hypothetical protein
MFARSRRRCACQVAGIAVEAMMAMALQSNGLARMVMRKETVSGAPFQ